MKSKTLFAEEIYIKLKSLIENEKGIFTLKEKLFSEAEKISPDMPFFLQGREGQACFYNALQQLVEEQLIAPVGKKTNSIDGLSHKYRILSSTTKINKEINSEIIQSISLPATLDYYIKNSEDFLKDKEIIEIISDFLRMKEKDGFVTVNERAYMLFGDEKFFKGDDKNRSRGETVLKRLGLSYADLLCEETLEPFFCFVSKGFNNNASRIIYIIENKDTFWSFKKSSMDEASGLQCDMLIYGEGKKIISSFRYAVEYGVRPVTDTFVYFGDIDYEGINIYCELCDKYPQYKILPFIESYQALLDIGLKHELNRIPKQQINNESNTAKFIGYFAAPYSNELERLLANGLYIPQEALSATEMKERFRI